MDNIQVNTEILQFLSGSALKIYIYLLARENEYDFFDIKKMCCLTSREYEEGIEELMSWGYLHFVKEPDKKNLHTKGE